MEAQQQFYINAISNPISDDSLRTKILKMVRHVNRQKKLRRGVKDVVKAIRKGCKGICILAADVSPVDVISHIPVLCEQNQIPYVFVRSRMQLGIAAETKKPTSVVLIQKPQDKQILTKFKKLHQKLLSVNSYI